MPVTQKYIPPESHYGTGSSVSASQPSAELVPSAAHTDRLACLNSHIIEPELLATYPRYPQRTKNEEKTTLHQIISWLSCLFYFGNWIRLSWGNQTRMALAMMVSIGAIAMMQVLMMQVLRIVITRKRRKEYTLLRHGVAVPAIVTQTTLGNGVSEKADSVRLSFDYLDSLGGLISKTITITMAQFQMFKLDEGNTFTLLMSPKQELNILPYFQLDGHLSILSLPVASSVTSSTSRGSVEQELLTSRPRRVRWEEIGQRQWRWIAYLFLISIPIMLASLKILFSFSPWSELPTALTSITLGATGIWVLRLLRSLSLLSNGVAARASITGEEFTPYEGMPLADKEPHLVLLYAFETFTGKTIRSKMRTPYRQAAELGLMVGSEFTVLYDAQSPRIHQPYFQFKLATISGPGSVRITPS